jgi:hypothetical protein
MCFKLNEKILFETVIVQNLIKYRNSLLVLQRNIFYLIQVQHSFQNFELNLEEIFFNKNSE